MGTDEVVDSHQPLPSGRLGGGEIVYITICPDCARRRRTTGNLWVWMFILIVCGLFVAGCLNTIAPPKP